MSAVFPEGAAVAVSLSFDDARGSQLDGVRILDAYGIRASFYVLPSGVAAARDRWCAVAWSGHEIGNHSNTHPCSANFEFSRANGLEDKAMHDIAADIESGRLVVADAQSRHTTPRGMTSSRAVRRSESCRWAWVWASWTHTPRHGGHASASRL